MIINERIEIWNSALFQTEELAYTDLFKAPAPESSQYD